MGFFSELSEKISKATPYKSEEEAEEDVAKEEITKNPQERTRLDNKVNCDNDTEAKVNMKGKGEEQVIEMEASVEELDLLLADFTIKSRERRRRRLR